MVTSPKIARLCVFAQKSIMTGNTKSIFLFPFLFHFIFAFFGIFFFQFILIQAENFLLYRRNLFQYFSIIIKYFYISFLLFYIFSLFTGMKNQESQSKSRNKMGNFNWIRQNGTNINKIEMLSCSNLVKINFKHKKKQNSK